MYAFFGDGGVGAREGFESLVGVGVSLAAQYGLDSLCHHCPAAVEVAADGFFVEQQLAQAFERALERDEGVAHRHADVAYYGRVGEVALQAADGELAAEVLEEGIGHAEVALGVLEVDGVHLVGHCARTHLALLDALLEIFHRNVLPEVAVKVDDDGVYALHRVEHGGEAVVVADLRGEGLALQSELLAHKAVAEGAPVVGGVGHVVRVVVARCAAELGCQRAGFEHGELLLETVGKHLDLLAEAGGRGGLAVRLGQHGNVFPLLRVSVELRDEFLNLRHVDLGEGVFEHEGERRVVDVL